MSAPPAAHTRGPDLRRAARATGVVLLVLAAVTTMVLLSRWQWDRGRERHSLVNYVYAVQWLLFAVLTVVGVCRLAVEGRRVVDESAPGVAVDLPAQRQLDAPVPIVGPPLRPGEDLEEVTLTRVRRRLGLDRR